MSNICLAQGEDSCYKNLNEVLHCFVKNDDGVFNYTKLEQESKVSADIKVDKYFFSSQKWPIFHNEHIPTTTWKHRLSVYIPKKVLYDTAMLFVTGGYIFDKERKMSDSKENLDYSKIALDNKVIVAVVSDIPNQNLFFDNVPYREDQILAYTYKQAIEDPMQNAYLLAHLPMAKAAIKAMDAVQQIAHKDNIEIDNFVISGASKRGWAAWLAAIEDNRVSAIMPIVIDVLNTQKNIIHICDSYGGKCPAAFKDYIKYGITDYLNSTNFSKLMEIDDPFSYLRLPSYSDRFKIPKYIISAAGDDFFVPDSTKFYFSNLPGEKYLRFLPESMHYLVGNPISDYLDNIAKVNDEINNNLYFHLNKINLPEISWNLSDSSIDISSSIKPKTANLWVAFNQKSRDFRFLNSYESLHFLWKKFLILFSEYVFKVSICDNCFEKKEINFACKNEAEECKISAILPDLSNGWRASFIELEYEIAGRNFVTTTEVIISPDSYLK